MKLKDAIHPACSAGGCGNVVYQGRTKKGMCGRCWNAYMEARKLANGQICIEPNCERAQKAKGLCSGCYNRKLRSKTHPPQPVAPLGTKKVNPDGYVVVKTGRTKSEWELEHRLVIEHKLGKPLAPGQNVHHLNGNRADNHVENLELWNVPQPSGVRDDDFRKYVQRVLPDSADLMDAVNRYADQAGVPNDEVARCLWAGLKYGYLT